MTTHTSYIPLTNFRGDSPIVWQGGPYGDLRYLVTIQHVLAHDRHHLLDMLEEDGALGATVLEFEGKLYSRDLLDSACEITFLLDHITRDTLNGSRIVDIGAGYGRLAHRLAALLPEAQIFCVDGIAVSTKICDAYIQFRHLQAQVKTVPLTELDSIPGPIFLATNVHSFSEMSRPAIAWWLDWLLDVGIYYLFIVPNLPGPSVRDGTSFRDLLDKRGFALVTSRAKFDDHLMDRYGLYPDVYYLFRHCGNADPSRTV